MKLIFLLLLHTLILNTLFASPKELFPTALINEENGGNFVYDKNKVKKVNLNYELADITPPVILLYGGSNVTLTQGNVYREYGHRAFDDVDRDVNVSILGKVDSSTVGTYILTYIAKDKSGNESRLIREITVVPKYRILVREVKGNTATYGKYASFSIYLSSKPDSNVSIHIESSNENEGIPGKRWSKDIIITPEYWRVGKQVLIEGTNKNVINGKQNYHIITSPAVSDDPHFNGINAEDVLMKGRILEFIKYTKKIAFVGVALPIEFIFKNNTRSRDPQKFRIINPREGMTVEPGQLKDFIWIPKEEDAGKDFEIEIEALSEEYNNSEKIYTTLHIHVAKSTVLKTEVKGNILTLIEENSPLKGISVHVENKDIDLSTITFMKVDEKDAQELPYVIGKLGEMFALNQSIDSNMTLHIPMRILPQDIHYDMIEFSTLYSNLYSSYSSHYTPRDKYKEQRNYHWYQKDDYSYTISKDTYLKYKIPDVGRIFYIQLPKNKKNRA